MSLIDQAQELESVADADLVRMAGMPDGRYPPFLIISEMQRRKKIRAAYQADLNKMEMPTQSIAEREIMEFSQGAMPSQPRVSSSSNSGLTSIAPNPMMRAAGGGLTRMQSGTITPLGFDTEYFSSLGINDPLRVATQEELEQFTIPQTNFYNSAVKSRQRILEGISKLKEEGAAPVFIERAEKQLVDVEDRIKELIGERGTTGYDRFLLREEARRLEDKIKRDEEFFESGDKSRFSDAQLDSREEGLLAAKDRLSNIKDMPFVTSEEEMTPSPTPAPTPAPTPEPLPPIGRYVIGDDNNRNKINNLNDFNVAEQLGQIREQIPRVEIPIKSAEELQNERVTQTLLGLSRIAGAKNLSEVADVAAKTGEDVIKLRKEQEDAALQSGLSARAQALQDYDAVLRGLEVAAKTEQIDVADRAAFSNLMTEVVKVVGSGVYDKEQMQKLFALVKANYDIRDMDVPPEIQAILVQDAGDVK